MAKAGGWQGWAGSLKVGCTVRCWWAHPAGKQKKMMSAPSLRAAAACSRRLICHVGRRILEPPSSLLSALPHIRASIEDERWLLLACLMAVILFFSSSPFARPRVFVVVLQLLLCRWPGLLYSSNNYRIKGTKERERKKDKHTERKERRLHFGPRLFLNECR